MVTGVNKGHGVKNKLSTLGHWLAKLAENPDTAARIEPDPPAFTVGETAYEDDPRPQFVKELELEYGEIKRRWYL